MCWLFWRWRLTRSSSLRHKLRILIDECLPIQLRHIFIGHDARTVIHMSWRSLSNGDLLAAAEREQFDVFLTVDARIPTTHDIARAILRLSSCRQIDGKFSTRSPA